MNKIQVINSKNYISFDKNFTLNVYSCNNELIINLDGSFILDISLKKSYISLFNDLHTYLKREEYEKIVLDFSNFELINSSAILLISKTFKLINMEKTICKIKIITGGNTTDFITNLLPLLLNSLIGNKNITYI